MSIGILLPLILIVGVMFMMTRSQKSKQRQALEMRSKMEPGTGVRTIGGMYAVVKEVSEETVLLEITDGVHAHFAKSAIGTVLPEDEFNRIVHGIEPEEPEGLGADSAADTTDGRISLDKSDDDAAEDASDEQGASDEDAAADTAEAADADDAADGASADDAVDAVKARGGSPAK